MTSGTKEVIIHGFDQDQTKPPFQIQAVTPDGLGKEVTTQFRTGAAGVFLLQDIDPGRRGLPLEAFSSGAAWTRPLLWLCAGLLFLLWRT